MLRIFPILVSLISIGSTGWAQPPEQCFPFATTKPPFYVSYSSEDRNFEDIKAGSRSGAVVGYVPRGSVVKVAQPLPPLLSLNAFNTMGDTLVDVTVLSTPNPRTDELARRAPSEIRDPVVGPTRRLDRIQPGRTGAIPRRFIRGAGEGDLLFVVERDSPLLNIRGLAGRAVRLAKTAGAYRINRCCTVNSDSSFPKSWDDLIAKGSEAIDSVTGNNPNCHDNYIFEVMKPNMTDVDRTFDTPACEAFSSTLRPLSADQALGISGLANTLGKSADDFMLIDERGLVAIPTNPASGGGAFIEGPCGSAHYWENPASEKPVRGAMDVPKISRDYAYDVFMDPISACAFVRLTEAQQQLCRGSGCQVKFGDGYHPVRWGGHKSHGKTTCIDVMPFTTPSGAYDKAKTCAFIELAKRAGAEQGQLFFNRGCGAIHEPGHDDHIHFCFPTDPSAYESQTVRKTCAEGLLSPQQRAQMKEPSCKPSLAPIVSQIAR